MESPLYGIFTLVGFVSEISLVRCAHSFDFRYFTNSCENPVRTRFPWSNLYMSYFGHVTSYELTYFKKMVRVWKTVLFITVFRRKNHMTFIFIKTMSHDLLRQMAYLMYVNLTFGKFALKLFNVNFLRVVNAHR